MSGKLLEALKFVFFILLLPLVVGTTVGFVRELNRLPYEMTQAFILGVTVYLIVHLFVFKPQGIYQYGQGLVSNIFKFFAPLVEGASFLLPVYSYIFLVGLAVVVLGFRSPEAGWYCMFLAAMALAMHFIFTSEALQEKEESILKPNYFFSLALIYVINIFVVAAAFYLILKDFSFTGFFDTATGIAARVYQRVFNQLFVP